MTLYFLLKGRPELKVLKMTQEIGFVEPYDKTNQIKFNEMPAGSVLELLQYHSCDTAARFGIYYVHDDNNVVIEEWQPCRCW